MGACAGVNGDTRVGRGTWAERAIWACWAAAVGEELGPRGVQLGQGFGLGFPGRLGWAWVELGEGLGWVWFSFSILFLSSFLFLIQTKFEFKYKFEFKPHSNN